jgi:hypothetical protein
LRETKYQGEFRIRLAKRNSGGYVVRTKTV